MEDYQNEYPDPGDEFDAMYADELEMLGENQEDFEESPKSKKKLQFPTQTPIKIIRNVPINTKKLTTENFEDDFVPITDEDDYNETHSQQLGTIDPFEDEMDVEQFDKIIANSQNQNLVDSEKSIKQLQFPTKTPIKIIQNIPINTRKPAKENFEDDFVPITDEDDYNETHSQQLKTIDPFEDEMDLEQVDKIIANSQNAAKRSIASLFGDIDDINDEEMNLPRPKKLKADEKNNDSELAMIEHILELRRLNAEKNNPDTIFGQNYTQYSGYNLRDNVSYIPPKYSNVVIKRFDGTDVYVRFHSELFEKEEKERIKSDLSFKGVMGGRFKEVWNEAQDILEKELLQNESQQVQTTQLKVANGSSLWVDLYKPKKYVELLSDESTNRIMLRWLKLWDKAVFNRRPKIKTAPKIIPVGKKPFFNRLELNTELDEHGRPQFKIALLCGPPGLGKTTLAHMVAKHAGYKVVEINASDDRSTEKFKTALENATQMSSVLDHEKRPNCLVFDEIDGAPSASIEFLIKYVNGTHIPKSKKGLKKTANILKRPIICICNDVYVPSLRSLRQSAFVVHFPPTASNRLAERLNEIARKQQIKTNMVALTALSEKSNNDIRSCLSVLHFFKSQDKPVTLTDVMKSNVGQKDVQKGLFNVWQDIFQIERSKNKMDPITLSNRWKKVQATVASFGDYERVAQGVFENYPNMNIKDSSLAGTCQALEWFCYSDIVSTKIQKTQNYSLSSYLQFGFVMWHYIFGSFQYQKLKYPSTSGDMRMKSVKIKGLLSEVMKGMKPSVRTYTNQSSIKLDVLPLLMDIITPTLRPVNLHLYTHKEKEQLTSIVSIMIDYNLNYIQERNQEGNYVFNIDPYIDEIVKFPTSKTKRILTYSNRQMVAREIEMEKMRRVEIAKNGGVAVANVKSVKPVVKTSVPNHLQQLKPKVLNSSTKGSGLQSFLIHTAKESGGNDDINDGVPIPNDIYFVYKEGYTNAVRKPVKVSSWL